MPKKKSNVIQFIKKKTKKDTPKKTELDSGLVVEQMVDLLDDLEEQGIHPATISFCSLMLLMEYTLINAPTKNDGFTMINDAVKLKENESQ